jgi:hypothetical protein
MRYLRHDSRIILSHFLGGANYLCRGERLLTVTVNGPSLSLSLALGVRVRGSKRSGVRACVGAIQIRSKRSNAATPDPNESKM